MIESKIKENVPLAPMTTFKIGGPARYFIEITNKEDLTDIFEWAKKSKMDYAIFSGGSNILVNDDGFDGVVIKIQNKKINVRGDRIETEAGIHFSQVVRRAIGEALSGLGWAIGVPGSVGGAIRGNAGCFGGIMSDSIETVEVFNIKKRRFQVFSKKDCKFDYRESIFKKDKNLLIWSAVLKMEKGSKADIDAKVSNIIESRNRTQPKLPSAGCIFKNIFFSDLKKESEYLADLAESSGVVKGGKVGAGWIISRLDIQGKKMGGTKISLEHANFIVNTGNAKASEVVMMISFIKQQVRDRFGIQLQEEVEYFGF